MSYRRKEVTLFKSNMESGPSNSNITCLTFNARALCAICGAPAIGRNFDAYTCLSCKAFFRRNAYNENLRSTCRVQNSCQVTMTTRRHCSACRLNKCFEQGMKKELIRSLIAINQASVAMMMNRYPHERLKQRITTLDLFPSNEESVLLYNDWNRITNIRNAYENYCIEPFVVSHEIIPLLLTTQPYRSRFKLQRLADLKRKYVSVLASFIKHILQYDTSIEHHYESIKDNFSTLLTINTSELMKSNILENLPWENDRLLFETILTENLLGRLERNLYLYRTFVPYDPLVVKLFLLILALTSRVSPLVNKDIYQTNHFQPFPMAILRVQNSYITLLWKYVIYRFGYHDATMYTVKFIQYFLHRQIIEADIMDTFRNRDDHGQLYELMERATTI